MRDHCHPRSPLHRDQACHQRRRRRWIGPGYRGVYQVLQVSLAILRRLGRNRVADSVPGIEPVSRRRLKAAAKRHQQILCDVMRRKSKLLRLRALDSHVQIGLIERLLDSEVHRAWDVADLFCSNWSPRHGCLRRSGRSPECRSEPAVRSSESG